MWPQQMMLGLKLRDEYLRITNLKKNKGPVLSDILNMQIRKTLGVAAGTQTCEYSHVDVTIYLKKLNHFHFFIFSLMFIRKGWPEK